LQARAGWIPGGLSWAIILRKRDAFLRAFGSFDPHKMARYDARRVAKISEIRNRSQQQK